MCHICFKEKNQITMSFTTNAVSAVSASTVNGTSTENGTTVVGNQLKELFDQVLIEKNEATSNLIWVDDETVEVTEVSGHCMHQFALRAEGLGKRVSYEKKIYIKIEDK